MSIPRAVKAQAEEATKIFEELQRQRQQTDTPPPEKPAAEASEPAEPTAATAPENTAAAPAEPTTTAAEQPETQTKEPQPDPWEQRYKVLKGKYDAEVPAMHRRITDLETLISTLQSKESEKPDTVPNLPVDKLVKPEEINDYGSDFMDVVGRRAQEAVAPTLKQLLEELSKIKSTVGSTKQEVQLAARDKVFNQLDRDIENWRTINASSEFLAWLNEDDVFAGVPRIKALREAFDANNASRVVGIFRKYLQENTAVTPASAITPKVNMETLAAPSRSRTAPAGAPTNAKVWNQREITAFYEDVRRKRVSPEDRRRIEADIMRAAAENRIVA